MSDDLAKLLADREVAKEVVRRLRRRRIGGRPSSGLERAVDRWIGIEVKLRALRRAEVKSR